MFKRQSILAAAIAAVVPFSQSVLAENSATDASSPVSVLSAEELTQIVQDQAVRIAELEAGQEATVEAIEQGGANLPAWLSKTSLGGYGEVHYNNLSADSDGDKDQIDAHRFVLYVAHQFSDTVRFFSEIELEHSLAGDGKPGEVELEQAFIEVDYAKNHSLRSGIVLLPVGFLNETHEPDTFYGVERNNVEKNIIPTTWWEAGIFFNGEIAEGLSYDVAVHSGLFLDGDAAIRSGRQKVAEAEASDLAYTARLKYNGVQGLEIAATLQHQADLEQGMADQTVDASLYEINASYKAGAFGLRALYAMWDIDDAIEDTSGVAGADEQEGFYIEPSYKINEQWGVFARYSEWDNTAGSGSDSDTATEQVDIGVNYWLKPTVVFKADYQDQSNDDDSKAYDGFNLGVGWSF